MMKKENPLRIKSKKWLVASLLELMKQKPYAEITIREIADLAELDRRTFYRHFSTKDDILYHYIDFLSEQYFERTSSIRILTIQEISTAYFEFWYDYLDFLALMYENNLQIALLKRFSGYTSQIYKILEDKATPFENEEYKHYAVAFKAGGFWNILMEWVSTGAKQKPQELAEIVSGLVMSGFIK